MAAEDISQGELAFDEDEQLNVDVSVALDEETKVAASPDDAVAKPLKEASIEGAEATKTESAPVVASESTSPLAASEDVPEQVTSAGQQVTTSLQREEEPEPSASSKIRSVQPTVPGLSPIDALDGGWDSPALEAPTDTSAAPPPSDAPAQEDRAVSGARPYADVPTPIVPVDFAGLAHGGERQLDLASATDADEQTVVRADAAAQAASAVEGSEPALSRVSESDQDEQTVVRTEGLPDAAEAVTNPLAVQVASIEPERASNPFAAEPPVPASPPPRLPIGAPRMMPPPLARGSVPPPPSRKASLPPPPTLDNVGASSPAPKPSRPMPLPPRPSLIPPPIKAAESEGDKGVLDTAPATSPLLAPPSMMALSKPPPPPPAPPVRAASLPPPPAPVSKRPSVPPPPPAFGASAAGAAFPPAATKVGPSENTPTVQVGVMSRRTDSADFTPTVQVQRAQGLGASRPLPPPARVPAFSGVPQRATSANEPIRPKSSSIAPLVDSIPPSSLAAGSRRVLLAIAALTLGVAVVFMGLRMRSGSVVVTVSSASGGSVKDVEVRVDDVVRCHATPCEVKGLEPGAHFVSASAAGLAAGAQRAFTVAPGERAAEHVALGSAERVHAELSVSGIGDGLRVSVDGRDLGAPPIAIHDIEPDTHVVRVTGPGRSYEPYEETVRLEPGESRSLGPVRLKLIRGRLELLPGDGSEGATVIVDGRHVPHLPATIELAADQAHEVIAQRRGFADFNEEVVFDNVAKRSLEVSLSPGHGSGGSSHVRSSSSSSSGSSAGISSSRSVSSSGASAGTGTLDIVSTPPSNVVVNGRPLGSTPLRSVKVPAGPQTVVFVHPSLGRKVTSTAVAAGGHGTVSVKF